MPASRTAPFTLTVLPSNVEPTLPGSDAPLPTDVHLSVHVDLNRAYDMTDVDAWYDIVRRFHRETTHASLFDLLCARISSGGVRVRPEASGQATMYRGDVTGRPNPVA